MKRWVLFGVLGWCLVGLLGCGGGGGSKKSEPGVASSIGVSSAVSSLASSTATQSSASNVDAVMRGYFRDAPVKGLSYVSCNATKTECLEGLTDANGEYLYKSGFNVAFNIENLVVLETTAKELITPYDESLTEQQSIGLARFLMSVDEDNDLNNGIVISDSVKALAKNTRVGTYVDWSKDDQLNEISRELNVDLPSHQDATIHLGAARFINYADKNNIDVINWFLNKKNLTDSLNKDLFNKSPSARLQYAIFLQVGPSLLANTDLVNSIDKVERIDKVAGLAIDWAKTLASIAVLDLDALDKGGAVIEKIYLAADTGKLVAEIIQNGVKTVHVIDGKDTKMEEQIASTLKIILSGTKGDFVDVGKETYTNFIAESEESKVLGEMLGVALAEITKNLKAENIKDILDRRGALIDTAAIGARGAVKAVLAGAISTANSRAEEYAFAYDYLNAYYSSGADENFMRDKFRMPMDLDDAATEYVNTDVVETILGTLSFSKRMSSKEIVHRYRNAIESLYSEFVASIGGIPLDNLHISLNTEGNLKPCLGQSIGVTASFFESKNSSSNITPFSLDWMLDDGISAVVLANKINISFDRAGSYAITVKAKKWAGGFQHTQTIVFPVFECANDKNADETIDDLIEQNQSSSTHNVPPVVIMNAKSNDLEQIILDGSDSYDPDGHIVRYVWLENEKIIGYGKNLILDGRQNGEYNFTLKITDNRGAVKRDSLPVTLIKFNGSVIEPEMVAIPGTTYAMSKYETTFDQYDAYVNETGADKPSDQGWGRGSRPVINVSWDDAVAYAKWLSQKTGKKYRLPTEEEWEFSARAGTTTNFSWGDEIGLNNANCNGCGSQWDRISTAPVGSFLPNGFGLFDMHGNVYEWTSSCRANGECVLSGGSWAEIPLGLYSGFRDSVQPSRRSGAFGFRLVQDLSTQASSSTSSSSRSSESSANQSLSSVNSSSLMGSSSSSVSSELQSSSSSTNSSNNQSSSSIALPEPEMVVIPAGSFQMGDLNNFRREGDDDEKPIHEVSLNSFAMSKYEITFAQYDAFANATGRVLPNDEGWGRGNRPVINVSWHDAVAYAVWLSEQTGRSYRLPRESEWEYAARAGTTTEYSWGNSVDCTKAKYVDCAPYETTVVGSYSPNSWGLYDVHGNVREWVQDYPTKAYGSDEDEFYRTLRSMRGGYWGSDAYDLRSANRNGNLPTHFGFDVGFRLAQDVNNQTPSNPINGAWVSAATCSWENPLCDTWLIFLNDDKYFSIQTTQPDEGCIVGIEVGSYAFNSSTGLFQPSPQVDTNDHCGVSDANEDATVIIDGNQLTYKETANSSAVNFIKLQGNNHQGVWVLSATNRTEVLVLSESTYVLGVYDNGVIDVEQGSYSFNQQSGSFLITTMQKDTNLSKGFSSEGAMTLSFTTSQLTIQKSGGLNTFSRVQ